MRCMQTTNNTESTTIESTIDRYLLMFNEADAARRSEQAHAVFVDDGRLVDPLIEATGPAQIAAAVGGLRDQMPGHSLTRTTAVDAHHTYARFGWTVNGPDGTVAVAGIDVVTFAPDGRIQSAIGFFGEAETVA
jgi:SnoaL-like domain